MKTSTQAIPEHHRIPRHIAVIMDGNGRWAKKRFMPRVMGHKKGLDALENLCAECSAAGVEYLTVFAFSTENWRRPGNSGLTLTIAADYGGRWDILQAVNKLLAAGKKEITESDLNAGLMLGDMPEPDLFIRTGGEMRISNFLLWQMAYAELYFTDTLWPDFDSQAFQTAIASFQQRERRFGRTSEQLPQEQQRN